MPPPRLYELSLGPGEGMRSVLRVACRDDRDQKIGVSRQFYSSLRTARRALRASSGRAASVDSSNSLFNEFARRSVADLYMLLTETEFGPYPFAGIPWFSTPFGRDGILTALFALWVDPSIAKGVLRFLAATQSTDFDPERDAEPGKILHEMRDGEMARLRRGAVRALLRQRRCDTAIRAAWSANTSDAPEISIRFGSYGRIFRLPSIGSTPMATRTVTGL